MFLEVSINNVKHLYAIESILCIEEDSGNAVLILKSKPDFRIITQTTFETVKSSLHPNNSINDLVSIVSSFTPGINKLLYKLNK